MAPAPSQVVVTGASGWLGQNLVRALAGNRERVRVLVPTEGEASLAALVAPTVAPVVGDVRDPAALDRLFAGCRDASVLHAAAIIHPRARTRDLFDVNVGGTALILDRARRAAATRFVHVSSNSPFGANPHPDHRFTEDSPYAPYLAYGRSKLEAEQLVVQAHERGDLATVIVRPPWFYGPFQPARQTRFFAAVRRGRFPMLGDGTNRRSLVYTGTLVQGLLRAEVADVAPGRAYWLADERPYEMREVLDSVRIALRAEGLAVVDRQPRLPVLAGHVAARLDAALQELGRYSQPLHVLGEMKDTIACDVTRARTELGFEPATDLVEGMRASVRWCLERGERL